jgi:UDP-N-acetylmuramyl pentapeptide phosphotransferase/UDP-N-acetylglucosamine-1-phosphate transferase
MTIAALLQPFLRQYMLARPNHRSSHKVSTPQGGGIAVVTVTIVMVAITFYIYPAPEITLVQLSWIMAAALLLIAVGVIDDIYVVEAVPRLLLQAVAVGIVVAALPADLRIISTLPWWIERVLIGVGSIWFVNLVNFMDGLDWMMVAEVVPTTAALVVFGQLGALPAVPTLVALALCGAMIGFAPFNRPVARLFLGDAGSLPIGLVLAWLLIVLAGSHFTAAALLPLYFVADATVTLMRRLFQGEPVMQSHRSHFYQRAIENGYSVAEVIGRIFALNFALALLAVSTLLVETRFFHVLSFAVGCTLVAIVLAAFSRRRRQR